eukprot:14474785-Ditylum_brightwellii.AAC.1
MKQRQTVMNLVDDILAQSFVDWSLLVAIHDLKDEESKRSVDGSLNDLSDDEIIMNRISKDIGRRTSVLIKENSVELGTPLAPISDYDDDYDSDERERKPSSDPSDMSEWVDKDKNTAD